MSSQLTDEELASLMPSELCQYQTPIPTQIVSSDEYYPAPQNTRQREVEARLLTMADAMGRKALALATGDPQTQSAAWHLVSNALRAQGRNQEAAEADKKALGSTTR